MPFIRKVTWQNYELTAPRTSFFLDVLTAGFRACERRRRPGCLPLLGAGLRGLRAGSTLVGPRAVPSRRGPGERVPNSVARRLWPGPTPGMEDRLPHLLHTLAQKCRGPMLSERAMKGACTYLCQKDLGDTSSTSPYQ